MKYYPGRVKSVHTDGRTHTEPKMTIISSPSKAGLIKSNIKTIA